MSQKFILILGTQIKSFARRIEINRAVLYAIFARAWGVTAGPVTALLIASKFTPTIQGFYYTFGSILALQIFGELGIGFAITQFASHEWAHLRIDETRRIAGDPDSLSRLASLAKFAVKWYCIAALIVIVGLSIGGYVFFSHSPSQNVNWKLPWFALCVLTGLNLFAIAIWSLLEGCNQVTNVNFYRLFQGLFGSFAAWIAILLGANLWTASILTFVALIYAITFLRRNYWGFFITLLFTKHVGPRLSWQNDILPFQWRIALSWASGYFISSLFTPVLFHYHGPIIAGQMGMTWSLFSVLYSISFTWISPRVPQFGMFVAQKRYKEMDRLFWRLTIIVAGITVLMAAAILLVVLGLNHFDHFISKRILPPLPTALFLLAAIINTASQTMIVYLRAHKKEPLLFISVLFGVLVGLSTWFLGKHYSALGMAAGFLAISAMIFPMIVFIWRRCKKAWH